MFRSLALIGLFLAGSLLPAPALAQTASPKPYRHNAMLHPARPLTFTNPAPRGNAAGPMSGSGCIAAGAGAAPNAVNPITGKAQAAPVVEVPLSKDGSTVASATTRAQQAQACAHPH
jgi:hypothetical protein